MDEIKIDSIQWNDFNCAMVDVVSNLKKIAQELKNISHELRTRS